MCISIAFHTFCLGVVTHRGARACAASFRHEGRNNLISEKQATVSWSACSLILGFGDDADLFASGTAAHAATDTKRFLLRSHVSQ